MGLHNTDVTLCCTLPHFVCELNKFVAEVAIRERYEQREKEREKGRSDCGSVITLPLRFEGIVSR